MPEKVHVKFGNGVSSPSAASAAKSPALSSEPPSNAHTRVNGVKRSRDGSPKHASPSKRAQVLDKHALKEGTMSKDHEQRSADGAHRTDLGKRADPMNREDKAHRPHKTAPGKGLSAGRNAQRNGTAGRGSAGMPAATFQALQKAREALPIFAKKADIKMALRKNDILLLNGETGSGKSTQVPQFLHNEPWCTRQKVKIQKKDGREEDASVGGIIAITQPRRVAAMTLAQRVAREMGTPLPSTSGKVGYAVRFQSMMHAGVKIKFVTEGILLKEMLHDPDLRKYSAVIVDEIHERSVDVDLIAGFLRNLLHGDIKGRGGIPLKVVVMSATLDLGGIEAFFAKSETKPQYKPGTNHGSVLLPHLLGSEVDGVTASENEHSRSGSYSSWDGLSGSDEVAATKKTKVDRVVPAQQRNGKARENAAPAAAILSKDDIADNVDVENGVAIEYVQGRQYPVQVLYESKPSSDYLQNMLQTILRIHVTEPMPGDILAFLTGQEEIESLQTQLESYAEKLVKTLPRMKVLPLYGSLSAIAQQEAFEPVKEKRTRKIVLATNIAETSVTVSGVRFVVDCGKSKVKQYRPRLGMESLLAKPISRVSAIQRTGRAGREAPGKCFRIYTEKDFLALEQDELPEIMRSDVIEAVLKMKAHGVPDVLTFPLMDSPELPAMEKALLQLHTMGALDNDGELTPAGKKMANFPLPAAYGRVLIAAAEPTADVLLEAIDVIACLTTDSEVYIQPKSEEDQDRITTNRSDIQRREGDVITLLTTMQRYAAEHVDRVDWCKARLVSSRAMKMALEIRKQLRKQCLQDKLLAAEPPADPQPFEPITPERAELLLKAFLKAFGTKTAVLAPDGSYLTTQGRNAIAIHPSSVLHGRKMEAIMFLDHVFTAKNYAKKVSSIQANWILEALEM